MADQLKLYDGPGMQGREADIPARTGVTRTQRTLFPHSAENDSNLTAALFSTPVPEGDPVLVLEPHEQEPAIGDLEVRSVEFGG